MAKRSKRYRALISKASVDEPQPLDKAVEILKGYATTKFDQTVEIAIRLGVDPKQADQIVRGSIVLPNGIGRSQRIIVFAKGDKADAAKDAGLALIAAEESVLAARPPRGVVEAHAVELVEVVEVTAVEIFAEVAELELAGERAQAEP